MVLVTKCTALRILILRTKRLRTMKPLRLISLRSFKIGKPGNKIRKPENDLIAAILKVKPTADMPRPGAQGLKPKKAAKRKRSK